MNIVLLSGGSGKRLWPLSNETRSKQFLKLLKNNESQFESMVQRVYRQIREAGIGADVLIATGRSQVHAIQNQLGDKVELVTEPERRDTFPAIALSAAYLAYKKHISLDEPILILPVDPYADLRYFHLLSEMEAAVRDNTCDMVLMGINPTYPSEKYGYILPAGAIVTEKDAYRQNADKQNFGKEIDENYDNKANRLRLVKRFIEKPSEEAARTFISQGALWNGGVFACRLGYITDILKQYLPYADYDEVLAHYGDLKKTSFDYEVVEKAKSVMMVTYDGLWKDMGTWNTLTEEMEETCIGSVVLGEGTTNTHVINELSIPIVVLGTTDVVVAASPDGILVSDKAKSSYLKPYVGEVNERPMYEERLWGEYKVLDYKKYDDTVKSLTKHLTVYAGRSISYQLHYNRDEIWTIVSGTGDLLIDGHVRNVRRGDVAYITKGQKHAIRATTDLHMIEVQIGEELIEEDIERLEWKW